MDVDPLIKILLGFGGVLFVHRCRVPLGIALLLGGIGLDAWGARPLAVVGGDVLHAFERPELWLLMVNITLIVEIGHFMATRENAQAIINAARRWGGKHGHAASLIAIPAAIGLVPMPGGALVSAPLVGETLRESSRPPEWQAAVNYWFRHILEYWWPLYPVVILTLSMFAIETWQFMAMQIPFTVVSVAAGYYFLLRPAGNTLAGRDAPGERIAPLIGVLGPIFLVVAATLLLPEFLRPWLPKASGAVRSMLAMLSGLGAGLIWVSVARRRQAAASERMFRLLFTRKTGNILLTLAGVMVFQSLLEASGLLPEASRRLAASRVPLALIVALLPLVAGLVTGIAVGFAGAAFPLVLGFLAVEGSGLTPLATLVLAFSAGYVGMMLSPVHLCFVLTSEFFVTPFSRVYRAILPCVASVLAAGVAFHLIYRLLGW